jgi:hypothetical protein
MHSINRKAALNLLQLPLVVLGKVDGDRQRTDEKDRQEQPGLPVVQRSGGQKDQSPRGTPSFSHVACGLGRGPSKTGYKSSS